MRLSASRIRSINRSIARVNGIVCGTPDRIPYRPLEVPKASGASIPPNTIKVVAVPKSIAG
jgi:hypothetical protein